MPSPEAEFARVAVIGAGTMGSGIAQVVATAGVEVTLIDRGPSELDRGMAAIRKSLAKLVEKGQLTDTAISATLERVATSTNRADAARAELVIEAVFEDVVLKRDLCAEITRTLGETALHATNTSSIPVTSIASVAAEPARVAGMHFFNPVPVLKLVEVVRAERSSAETVERIARFASFIGKTPVTVEDSPGFVANRILVPMINEAIFCLGEGVADPEAIDEVMKLGAAHPMGPLALADLVGLDVCLAIMDVLHRDFGDSKYRPAPLLRRMVAAGKLGRKSGEGFFRYDR